MTHTQYLETFYKSYACWLDEGAPEGIPHSRHYALCGNAFVFYTKQGMSGPEAVAINRLMINQFRAAGLDKHHPFNTAKGFYEENEAAAHHTNPARIKWVKEHAQ